VCACTVCVSQGGKKGRKRSKKKTDLDRDLEEAEAGPDAKELALLQSHMLEVGVQDLRPCVYSNAEHSGHLVAYAGKEQVPSYFNIRTQL
jgi:hypothetical protein